MEENYKEGEEQSVWRSFMAKYTRKEFVILLVIGVIVGVAVKANASSQITMGYDDYLVVKNKQSFDYTQMAQTLAEENEGGQVAAPSLGGAACGG